MGAVSSRRSVRPAVLVVLVTSAAVAGIVPAVAGASGRRTVAAPSHLAGYTATTPSVTSLGATVTVPAYTCVRQDALSAMVATYDAGAAAFDAATLYLGCTAGGTPSVSADLELVGVYASPTVVVAAGDQVRLTLTCGPGGTIVALEDLTTAAGQWRGSTSPAACAGAFVADDGATFAGGNLRPLPVVAPIDYSAVSVDGAALGAASPTAVAYREGARGRIATSALTAGGTAFTTTAG